MTVRELRQKLFELPQDAVVYVNDEPLAEVEPITTDEGPAVELWSESHVE